MKAAILHASGKIAGHPLRIEDIPLPAVPAGHVLLRVRACGVCRTDLHIIDGELPSRCVDLIPGHQIVGEIVDGVACELADGATPKLSVGTRVWAFPGWVAWTGHAGIAGTAWRICAMRRCLPDTR